MGGESWQEKIRRQPCAELLPDWHIPLSADEKLDPSSSVRRPIRSGPIQPSLTARVSDCVRHDAAV